MKKFAGAFYIIALIAFATFLGIGTSGIKEIKINWWLSIGIYLGATRFLLKPFLTATLDKGVKLKHFIPIYQEIMILDYKKKIIYIIDLILCGLCLFFGYIIPASFYIETLGLDFNTYTNFTRIMFLIAGIFIIINRIVYALKVNGYALDNFMNMSDNGVYKTTGSFLKFTALLLMFVPFFRSLSTCIFINHLKES